MEKYLTKGEMYGKQSQWILQLCQLEIRSSFTKKKKIGKTDVYFYFYYLLISKVKASVMVYEIRTLEA